MKHIHPGAFENAPIELKGEEGEDAATIVTKALDNLRTEVSNRLDKIEARQNRPAPAAETKAAEDFERTAFMSYVRRGVERMGAEEQKALAIGDGTGAGYLAPKVIGDELIKLLVQYSPIRAYATVKSIGGRSITYPRRTGSIAASWVSETGTRTPSDASFEQIELTPGELIASTVVSNQLLEDNQYDLEAELLSEYAEQFGVSEGAAFVSGNGTNKPFGLLSNTSIRQVITGDATKLYATGKTIVDTILALFHGLPQVHAQNGAWLMNRNTIASLRGTYDSLGRPMLIEGLINGPAVTILGRPVVEAMDMPDIAANATPILFGDLKAYRIVDRIDFQLMRDPFTMAGTGQTKLYARKRVGADITHPDRLLKLKVSAT